MRASRRPRASGLRAPGCDPAGAGARLHGWRLASVRRSREVFLERGPEPRVPLRGGRAGSKPGGGIDPAWVPRLPDRLRPALQPRRQGILRASRSPRGCRAGDLAGAPPGAALLSGAGLGAVGRMDAGRHGARRSGRACRDLARDRPDVPKRRAARLRRARVARMGGHGPRIRRQPGVPGSLGAGRERRPASHSRDSRREVPLPRSRPGRVPGPDRSVAPRPRAGSRSLVGPDGLCLRWDAHVPAGGAPPRRKTAARRRGEPP